MYVLRMEGSVPTGRAAEFHERAAEFADLLGRQTGFDRGALLNSFGYPQKHVWMLRFVGRDAALAAARGPQTAAFVARHPFEGIFLPSRPVEAYELVHAVRGSGEPHYAHLADWTIATNSANVAAFEAGRKELFELRQQHGRGYVANLLARFLGGQGRYLMYSVYTDEASATATAATPESRQWVQAHPASLYGGPSPTQETYELLQVILPR